MKNPDKRKVRIKETQEHKIERFSKKSKGRIWIRHKETGERKLIKPERFEEYKAIGYILGKDWSLLNSKQYVPLTEEVRDERKAKRNSEIFKNRFWICNKETMVNHLCSQKQFEEQYEKLGFIKGKIKMDHK